MPTPDDIAIDCGGTILHIGAEVPGLAVRWIVFSGDARRGNEARNGAATIFEQVSKKQTEVLEFRDGYFPSQGADIKDYFESVKLPTLIRITDLLSPLKPVLGAACPNQKCEKLWTLPSSSSLPQCR
jgi:hypothetical protein